MSGEARRYRGARATEHRDETQPQELKPQRTRDYGRVSTEEQAKGGHSINKQRRYNHAWAKEKRWPDPIDYEDEGYSATDPDRPGMSALRHDVEPGDLVIGLDPSRFFRDVRDQLG